MLGLQSSKSLKHAKKQQNFDCFRIFAEFSRKFARKVHEEPHRLGLRFFFYTIAKIAKVFRRLNPSCEGLVQFVKAPETSVAAFKISDFCVDRFVATFRSFVRSFVRSFQR